MNANRIVHLSNGTVIEEILREGYTDAVVVAEKRCMTDAEWDEYVRIVLERKKQIPKT